MALKLEDGQKIYFSADNATAENVLSIVDWDNFQFKDWRFVHTVAFEYVAAYDPEGGELRKLKDEINKHLSLDKAIEEAIRVVGDEKYKKYIAPLLDKWRVITWELTDFQKAENERLGYEKYNSKVKEWEMRDSLYGGLSSHTGEYPDDEEFWERKFSQFIVAPSDPTKLLGAR